MIAAPPARLHSFDKLDLNRSDRRPPTIFIDADACPVPIKAILFRTAERRKIETVVVANQSIAIPKSRWIRRTTVSSGIDQADHAIVAMVGSGDLVVADDIPLAARVVEQGGIVIGSRGDLLDEKSIHHRLATRNLMEQLRLAGVETSSPKPFGTKDVQAFANQLDRMLTKLIRSSRRSS